jgi:hypothetical protein
MRDFQKGKKNHAITHPSLPLQSTSWRGSSATSPISLFAQNDQKKKKEKENSCDGDDDTICAWQSFSTNTVVIKRKQLQKRESASFFLRYLSPTTILW